MHIRSVVPEVPIRLELQADALPTRREHPSRSLEVVLTASSLAALNYAIIKLHLYDGANLMINGCHRFPLLLEDGVTRPESSAWQVSFPFEDLNRVQLDRLFGGMVPYELCPEGNFMHPRNPNAGMPPRHFKDLGSLGCFGGNFPL